MTFLGRGNPVPCYLNMHFLEEIERIVIVAVDTVLCDQVKYSIFILLDSSNWFYLISSTKSRDEIKPGAK